MAAKGTIAKTKVEEKIIEAFGTDFIGISDKKIYVTADDGGQKVQIAINLTCPKVGIPESYIDTGVDPSFIEGSGVVGTYTGTPVVEMTAEEQETINTLIAKLGL